ncbi:MAG: hypothetical protein ACHQ9S_11660 [Candidatus Binatia bacterium]
MLSLSRGLLIAACWLAAVTLQPAGLLAEETAHVGQDTAQTAPAEKPAEPKAAGCNDPTTGSCCATTQDKAADAPKAEPVAPEDCPCKHAKPAPEKS